MDAARDQARPEAGTQRCTYATRLRQQFLEWAAIPDLRRIMSHGRPIEHDAARALMDLVDTLN